VLGAPAGYIEALAAKDRAADLYDAKAVLSALLPNQEITLKPKDREGFVLAAEIKASKAIGPLIAADACEASMIWDRVA
jgi:hypothetical protein